MKTISPTNWRTKSVTEAQRKLAIRAPNIVYKWILQLHYRMLLFPSFVIVSPFWWNTILFSEGDLLTCFTGLGYTGMGHLNCCFQISKTEGYPQSNFASQTVLN